MTITERIDTVTGIPEDYRREILPAPKSVKIELTSRCNLKCSFCAQSMHLREQGDMDKELFKRIVVEMRQAGVEEIGFFYLGEPLLTTWLDDAVYFAKHEAGFPYTFITTNGTLAKPSRLDKLFRAGLDSLKFSFNYTDRDQFEEIARSDPRLFDIMVSNVMSARHVRDQVEQEIGHRCHLYASYIKYDNIQDELMERWLHMLTPILDEVYALPLYSQAEFTGDGEREKGWDVTAGNRGRVGALREPLPCWAVFTEAHVTFDGKLAACCFSHQGFEMGDLTQQSFMDAWNSEKFQQLRAAHLRKDVRGTECEVCMAYRT